jgi:bacterial/archaeal transporter family-2 protein
MWWTVAKEAVANWSGHKDVAAWTLLAGASIPLIGVLNSGMARSVGNPFAATTVMFAIALAVALGITLPLYGHPT